MHLYTITKKSGDDVVGTSPSRQNAAVELAMQVQGGEQLKLPVPSFLAALCKEATRCEDVFHAAIPLVLREFDEDRNGLMSQVEVTTMIHRMAGSAR